MTSTSEDSMLRERHRLATMILATVLAVTLLAACGDNDEDTTVTAPGTSPTQSPPAGDGAQPIAAEPGVGDDIRSRPFDRADISDDGSAVDVYFSGGVEECYVVDRIDVDRTDPNIVELALFDGRRPGADVCIEIAVSYVTTVALDPPVAVDADVVDGTDGEVKS